MLSSNVTPVTDWNITPGITSNGPLPGSGEDRDRTKLEGDRNDVRFRHLAPSSSASSRTSPSRALASPNLLAAAAVTNPIVLENQKLGNPESEWGIDGAGSSNIEGFATDISVNHGNTVNFKIKTNSNELPDRDLPPGLLRRHGCAKRSTTIQHTGCRTSRTPLRDATTGLVDAGNWAVSASWDVPADAVSGVYIAKLVRQDGDIRREPHPVHRAGRQQPERHHLPDRGHDVASLQRMGRSEFLWRQRPRDGPRRGPRLCGEL